MWVLYGNKNVELESLSPADDILATDYKNDRNLWDKLLSSLKEMKLTPSNLIVNLFNNAQKQEQLDQ